MADKIPKIATATEIAKIIGCSTKTVYKHIKRAGIKPDSNKEYVTHDVLEAVYEHRRHDNNCLTATKDTGNALGCQHGTFPDSKIGTREYYMFLLEKYSPYIDWVRMLEDIKNGTHEKVIHDWFNKHKKTA